jgi:hypothetical protein
MAGQLLLAARRVMRLIVARGQIVVTHEHVASVLGDDDYQSVLGARFPCVVEPESDFRWLPVKGT